MKELLTHAAKLGYSVHVYDLGETMAGQTDEQDHVITLTPARCLR